MIYSLKEFMNQIIFENLHPEIKAIVTAPRTNLSIKHQLVKKVKELSERGENTGITGMPEGSSRVYLDHKEPESIVVDGHNTSIHTGTKVAIRADLDEYHNKRIYDNMSLGQLQNEAEGGDNLQNAHYRVLTKDSENPNHYHSNTETGIFPPLIDHDHKNHEWSHVGHVNNLTKFKKHTITESHPKGISHNDFVSVLLRAWNKDHGKYHKGWKYSEKQLDHIEQHPLCQRFLDHQRKFTHPPHDYHQKANLGLWTHPLTEKTHIVARDHGFNRNVMNAYHVAIHKENRK